MGNIPLLKAGGLYTSNNELGVQDGAMTEAKNLVIRSKDLVEPRRGFEDVAEAFTTAIRSLFVYDGTLYAFAGSINVNGVPAGSLYRYDGVSALTSIATLEAPEGGIWRSHAMEAKDCAYFTTSLGVYKLDSNVAAPKSAGLPMTMDIRLTNLDTFAAVKWLPSGSAVGYVYLFGTRDATGRVILGAPSAVKYQTNTTTAAGMTVIIDLARGTTPEASTSHFVQLYRTKTALSQAAVSPDFFQVAEYSLTATDLPAASGAWTIQFSDQTPDAALSRLGYFSANAQGLSEANNEPPFCRDVALFGSRVLYSNTSLRHTQELDILGVNFAGAAGNTGLKNGDKIRIAGQTFTASTGSSNPVTRVFQISNAADPYTAIYNTAQEFLAIFNHTATTAVGNGTGCMGYSIATETGSPGAMYFTRNAVSDAVFSINAESSTSTVLSCFNPALPVFATNGVASSNETGPNRIYFSKRDIPEAVPRKNYITVGAENKKILRMCVLRDRVFIFKEDGIFGMSGEAPYRVYPLDPTAICVAPDSVCTVNNQVFALTTQGVVAVSDAGATVVSKGIERELVASLNSRASNTRLFTGTWACGYESERLYVLGLSVSGFGEGTTSSAGRVYCYNVTSAAWTWWDRQPSHGLVDPATDRLYFSSLGTFYAKNRCLMKERKSLLNTDYHDEEISLTVSSAGAVTGTQTLALSGSPVVSVGDGLTQTGGRFGLVTDTTTTPGSVVVEFMYGGPAFIAGTVTQYRSYECIAEWAARAPGGTGASAQAREIEAHFRTADFFSAQVGLATDVTPIAETLPVVVFPRSNGWDPTNSVAWSSFTEIPCDKRVGISRNVARAKYFRARFSIREANAMWALQGLTLIGDPTSERGGK